MTSQRTAVPGSWLDRALRGSVRCAFLLSLFAASVLAACGGAGNQADDSTTNDDLGAGGSEKPELARILVWPDPEEDLEEILEDAMANGAQSFEPVEGTPFYLVILAPGTDPDAFLEALDDDVRVVDGERDIRLSSAEGGAGTLPVGQDQFDFSMVGPQPELQRIGLSQAGNRATGAGVRVAVIDSGVVATHVLLQGRIEAGGYDFVDMDNDPTDEANGLDDDEDGLVDEGFGHGTFVSSLILAIAPDVTILPFRVLDSDSNGLASHVAQAMNMAVEAGVDVINLSLGMEHKVGVIGEAIRNARDNGILVIASAGNTGAEEATFPATISIALSTTAVDPNDQLAPFASYGDDVDLSAPGAPLLGAYPSSDFAAAEWGGTSFAAALVTGGYALVKELQPTWSFSEISAWLADTAVDIDPQNTQYTGELGEGRLDLDAATTFGP